MATNGLSMKLMIDTKAQRVCFAEAGSDVFEFLSCLLCLPISTITNLLTKDRMVGSIGNVQDLDAKFLISSKSKEPYLTPAVAPTALRPLQELLHEHDAPLSASTRLFTCEARRDCYGTHRCGYFSAIKGGSKCPACSKVMNTAMPHVKPSGFVVGTATYTIMDDLSITPASSVSGVAVLAECGVKDLSSLQQKTVKIGKQEAQEILLASLKSKTVLTDVFLHKEKVLWKKEA